MMRHAGAWLRRRAENVAAAMVAVMFFAFIVQIVFRYFLNFPVGWTSELSVVMWLWLVLWGAAFVVKERDEIRMDLLGALAGRRGRIAMGIVGAVALLVLYGVSLKPSFDYVSFMKVERSSYLKIRMDWLFSIYIVFLLAILIRYVWLLWHLVRGEDLDAPRDVGAGSGL